MNLRGQIQNEHSDLNFYNVFGRADSLTAVILQTFDPTANLYGGLAYETPIFRHDWSVGLGYSKNSFDIVTNTVADTFNFGGETDIATLFIKKNLKRTRRSSVNLAFDLSVKAADCWGKAAGADSSACLESRSVVLLALGLRDGLAPAAGSSCGSSG